MSTLTRLGEVGSPFPQGVPLVVTGQRKAGQPHVCQPWIHQSSREREREEHAVSNIGHTDQVSYPGFISSRRHRELHWTNRALRACGFVAEHLILYLKSVEGQVSLSR